MVELNYVVVGVGNDDSIHIEPNEKVKRFRTMIYDQRNYKTEYNEAFDASKLQLYLAKTVDEHGIPTFFKSQDEDIKALRKGDIRESISNITKGDLMDTTATIQQCIDEANLPDPAERQIHILVVVPPAGGAGKFVVH